MEPLHFSLRDVKTQAQEIAETSPKTLNNLNPKERWDLQQIVLNTQTASRISGKELDTIYQKLVPQEDSKVKGFSIRRSIGKMFSNIMFSNIVGALFGEAKVFGIEGRLSSKNMEHIIKKQADQDRKHIIAKKLENDYQLPPGSVKASLQDSGNYLFCDSTVMTKDFLKKT